MTDYDDDIADLQVNQERRAQGRVFASLDDDPQKASRAIQLSDATGVPPAVVHGDMDHYDSQTKAEFSSNIVAKNQFLRGYINSHDLAASVSNDDLGQLDTASQSISKLGQRNLAQAFIEGFGHGAGEGGFGSWIFQQPGGEEWAKAHPAAAIAYSFLGAPYEAMRALGGVVQGTAEMGGQYITDMTGYEPAKKQSEQFGQFIQDPGFWASLGLPSPFPRAKMGDIVAHNQALHEAARPFDLYLQAGKEPPIGVNPAMDKFKADQAGMDLGNLKEALKESEASATRERSPELYAEFVKQHVGDQKIGISAEKVAELYGDKLPHTEDNILGWVPGIKEQLETAVAHGGDIEVPLADYLAKVDPAVHKELEDHIRVRDGGVTKEEAKEASEQGEAKTQAEAQQPTYEERLSKFDEERESLIGQGKAGTADPLMSAVDYVTGPSFSFESSRKAMDWASKNNRPDIVEMLLEKAKRSVEASGQQKPGVDPSNVERYNRIAAKLAEQNKADTEQLQALQKDFGQPPATPVDIVRQAAALEPVFDVYHGSPHDFSAFSMEKIGSGEGAQSYGHGLYFAENRKVAEQYSRTVPNANLRRIAELEKQLEGLPEGNSRDHIREQISDLEQATEPNLYRTRIKANKEHFLDWDKPIQEQHPKVREALKKLGYDETVATSGEDAYRQLQTERTKYGAPDEKGMRRDMGDEAASATLREAGIPGIKYLDQGSRITEPPAEPLARLIDIKHEIEKIKNIPDGEWTKAQLDQYDKLRAEADKIHEDIEAFKKSQETSNFVLFDDKLAEITHKNDVPVAQPKRPRQPKQLELNLLAQLDERDAFENAKAIGMTVDGYKRYLRAIEKQKLADLDYETKKAIGAEKQRQTQEWRANEAEVRKETIDRLNTRPDIQADRFFRESKLDGQTLPEKPKLNPEFLTDEQQDGLPKSFQSTKGMHPDDAGNLLGYTTGDQLIDDLVRTHKARQELGGRPEEYFRHLVTAETEVEMQKRYGDLGKNILREAQEQALSATQLDILHEEVLALGLRAGSEFPITKAEIGKWVEDRFSSSPMSAVDVDKYLASAGKAGRAAEAALLKDDAAMAFREKQKQYLSVQLAKQAKDFVKEQERFEKTAKRFAKREVSGTAQEYTNMVHDILMRVGERVNRSVQDLSESMQKDGYSDLTDFVNKKSEQTFGMLNIPVADFLQDVNFRKQLKDMSIDEYRQVKDSVDVLAKLGRNENKINIAGVIADRADVIGQMKENLQTFPLKEFEGTPSFATKAMAPLRSFLANSTAMETLLNRFDRDNPNGIFNKAIVYPLAKAANEKSKLIRDYSKPYGKLGEIKDMNKLVESPLIDPMTITKDNPEGSPIARFTRGNVQTMIHNAGNAAQWDKFARGWGKDPEQLMKWLFQNSTKEMWDRAQQMGKTIFEPAFEQAQEVYHRLYGIAPEKIALEPVNTPFGIYDGWYHPLIKDSTREFYLDADGKMVAGQSKKQLAGEVYDNTDNFHARTTNGYTKGRTNIAYPIDLNPDMIPVRLTQMLHDIAFREAIVNTEKFFSDPGLRTEIAKRYGEHYRDQLMPYLRGIAGQEGIPSKALGQATALSEYFRSNVIGTYIGFNPYTAMKHGPTALVMSIKQVGATDFLQAVRDLGSRSEDINMTNRDFVDANSMEVARRHRHWQDTIAGEHAQLYGEGNLREKIIEKGSWLVAQSDMLSVRPTWLAAYRNAIRDGAEHPLAVDQADAAVRKAHGSTAATNQPGLVSGGGPLHGWLTSIYGFFGTVLQRRLELAHAVNDAYQLGRAGELAGAAKAAPDIIARTMAYVVWPTLVEEYVSGLTTDDKRGWGSHIMTGLASGLASPVLYLRDIVHGFTTGHDPGAGLITSFAHDIGNVARDVQQGKKIFSKERAGKTVGDLITALGDVTGKAPKAVGSLAHFGIDYANKQTRPKTFTDWRMGLTRGTTKKYEIK